MKLWVLWELPDRPIPADNLVISLLQPADEVALLEVRGDNLLIARELSQNVRNSAVALYRDLVARIGTVECSAGRTLRQRMGRVGNASLWWYHPVTYRGADADPTLNNIIQILTVVKTAIAHQIDTLAIYGAPESVVDVLRSRFKVEAYNSRRQRTFLELVIRGVASRLRYLIRFFWHRRAIDRMYKLPRAKFDVVFSNFWDWGLTWEESDGRYIDRYFKRLPSLLSETGIKSGYFVWFSPDMEPWQRGRDISEVLKPLRNRQEVIVLQALLNPIDVLKVLINFKVLRVINKAFRNQLFHHSFKVDGLDWFALFRGPLLSGAVDSNIPQCQLVTTAMERAARSYRPRITLSFLEHFPYSRALYEGVRLADIQGRAYAVQHASYTRENTEGYLHPELEFNGKPDGCGVPHPDRIFAMGEIGREVFLEHGYARDDVLLTGSPRYDHVVFRPNHNCESRPVDRNGVGVNVLVACSLDVNTEIGLVEAVALAAKGIESVVVRMRNHPASRVDEHPRFEACRGSVQVSDGTLDEDLAWADVILFSFSTVADEAYIQGKPVWQWLPMSFNGSATVVAARVPQFGSVAALKNAFEELIRTVDRPFPTESSRAEATRKLFHLADGHAAERIAAILREQLAADWAKHE